MKYRGEKWLFFILESNRKYKSIVYGIPYSLACTGVCVCVCTRYMKTCLFKFTAD